MGNDMEELNLTRGGGLSLRQQADVQASVDAGDAEAHDLRMRLSRFAQELSALQAARETVTEYRVIADMAIRSREPMNATTVGLTELAIRNACKTVGLHDITISTEEFGRPTISLEAIDDKLKKIWERIKTMLAKIMETLRSLFAKFTDRSQKLQSKIADVEANLSSGVKAPDDLIAVNGRVLVMGSTIPNMYPELSVKYMAEVRDYLTDNGAAETYLKNILEGMSRMTVDTLNTPEQANYVTAYAASVGKRLQGIHGASAHSEPVTGDDVAYSSGKLLGNVAFVCYTTKPGGNLQSALRRFSTRVVPLGGVTNIPEQIAPLSQNNIASILAAVKETTLLVASLSGYLDTLCSYSQKAVDAGDAILNKTPDDKKSQAQAMVNELPNLVKSVLSGFDEPIKYTMQLAGELVSLCDRSVA